MKKVVSLLCLSIALASTAYGIEKNKPLIDQVGDTGYGLAGCGLGSIIFGDKPGMVQIVAATTNGIYSNQTFGMTSGTSNCAETGGNKASASLFITANREALEKDISRGNGETLMNLSQIMGCQDSKWLGTKLQSNYGKIFPSAAVSTESVVDSIIHTVESDAQLSQSCGNVG